MHKFLSLSLIVLLAACARNMLSSNYVDSAASGVVLEGVIVSARPVTISGADKLADNSVGVLGGGVAGGALGSTIGRGGARVAATVGGAVAGAVTGAVVEDSLSESDGFEYIVKISRENTGPAIVKGSQKPAANAPVNTTPKTELISVVQGKDVTYAAGQPVYVIYSDDRPRLLARQ